MNNRANVDIVAFIFIVIGLLILAPIMSKIVNTSLTGFSDGLNDTSTEAAGRVDHVKDTFNNFWDYTIAIAFLINVLMLFVFAFLIESKPIFSLFYMLSMIFLFMFSHYVVVPIQTILGMSTFSDAVATIPIVNFLVLQFDLILLGIVIITGIIMYSQFKASSGGMVR